MTVDLPLEYQQFVEGLVGVGEYDTPFDVIRDGLDLVRAQSEYRRNHLEQMKQEVELGIEQMRRGEVVPFDPMALLKEVEEEFALGHEGGRD